MSVDGAKLAGGAGRERGSDLLVPLVVISRWRTALWQFLVRAIARRYRASLFGLLWVLMVPMATLAIYAFVFGTVLQVAGARQALRTFLLGSICLRVCSCSG